MGNAHSRTIEVGEFVELEAGDDLLASPRYNDDIAPTKAKDRTWSRWNVASLWVGMAICVPTYTLGGVLTAYFGLSVAEALWTILIANIVVLIPLTLNAFPGTRYGIPCPVVLRASFGIIGSNVPALIRAIVACGWFGVQTLFGGIAIHLMFSAVSENWAALGGTGEVIGFFIFWVANVTIVIRGADSIKLLEALAAPLLLAVAVGLIFWALPQVSLSEVLSTAASRPADAPFFGYFMAALTAMVGFWATLSLNIPDFSRFAESQKSQIVGQIIGLPLTMFLFSGLGVLLTAASAGLVGETISDPINLIGRIDSPFWVVISMLIIILATISTNTAANVVSPTNSFQNIAPRFIDETKGVLLTGVIGIALMSWELLKKLGWLKSDVSLESLYSNWLIGYSSLLGPIAGIMVVDYFLVRKQRYDLLSLYRDGGSYPAWHVPGFVAFLLPVALTLVALTTGHLSWFYDYGWFTGSLLGGVIYYLMSRG
ncbi:MAG: NCS1 family nucleobase:cation symporter-1 [Gammaproteobacteria bacterium]|nr:NCS1 family nucleobase:cation symporter-1 [Gammaproteobacteria bacterium]MDH4314057.1 NCS1 family nucleobase:cation symporter-1 [Gammaproteobacteria bacterium]MDH5213503.1 NCS1 family nucleobase:cation symporter-1 [Gammaproteobacteria bacterium]MDH5500301.1 NCS1 family nucleobase:cation symporter-1 [Gammaproteobacteria bacterium]